MLYAENLNQNPNLNLLINEIRVLFFFIYFFFFLYYFLKKKKIFNNIEKIFIFQAKLLIYLFNYLFIYLFFFESI